MKKIINQEKFLKAITAESDVIAVDVKMVSDLARQWRFFDGSGFVSSGGELLAHLKDSVIQFDHLLPRMCLQMNSTLLKICVLKTSSI